MNLLGSLHLLQVETGLRGPSETPCRQLLLVRVLDLAEVKRNLIGRVNAALAAFGLERRYEKIVNPDLHIVLLLFPALRAVNTAEGICWPVAHASINFGLAAP